MEVKVGGTLRYDLKHLKMDVRLMTVNWIQTTTQIKAKSLKSSIKTLKAPSLSPPGTGEHRNGGQRKVRHQL